MRILLIVDDYMPNSTKVAAKMMHELACEYVNQGHAVTVITPSFKSEIVKLDDVKILQFRSGEVKNISRVKRAINETLLSFRAWKSYGKFLKSNKHDIIVYYSPSIFFGPLVYKLKKIWKVKSYLILRDIFPQWVIDNKILKKHSLITYYFKFFEQINYRNADVIGLMSSRNLEWFKSYFRLNISLEVLYNWADVKKEKKNDFYRQKLELLDKVVFFYGGNMGTAQDMMNIIRLAKKMLPEEKAHFILVGTGDEVKLVNESISKYNLSNTTFLPPVNQKDFKKMLAEFDVGLFTLHRDHKTHNFPGKLLGYMVQEMPILGSVNLGNDLKELIESSKAGFITVNGDDDNFYENAISLLKNTKLRKEMGINSNKLLNKYFSVESISKQILDSIEKKYKI